MGWDPGLHPVQELEGMKHKAWLISILWMLQLRRAWRERKASCACVTSALLTKHSVLSHCPVTPVLQQNEERPQGVPCEFRECRWVCIYSADRDSYSGPSKISWFHLNCLKVDGCYSVLYWAGVESAHTNDSAGSAKETGTEGGYAFLSAQLGLEEGICLKWAVALKIYCYSLEGFVIKHLSCSSWLYFPCCQFVHSDLPRIMNQ